MTVLEIYERVNLVKPIEQRHFFNYFAESVSELMALYDGYVFEKGKQPTQNYDIACLTLKDDNTVLPLYHDGIVDNILFLSGAGDAYKSEFVRKSRLAFLKYWNDDAKGRRVRRMRW